MVVAGYAFIWAVRSDQFDDMEGPAHQILFDEDIRPLDEKTVDEKNEKVADIAAASNNEVLDNETVLTAQKRLEDEDRS